MTKDLKTLTRDMVNDLIEKMKGRKVPEYLIMKAEGIKSMMDNITESDSVQIISGIDSPYICKIFLQDADDDQAMQIAKTISEYLKEKGLSGLVFCVADEKEIQLEMVSGKESIQQMKSWIESAETS
jgi:hypothetical protein